MARVVQFNLDGSESDGESHYMMEKQFEKEWGDDGDADVGGGGGGGGSSRCRRATLFLALLAVVLGASAAIGLLVTKDGASVTSEREPSHTLQVDYGSEQHQAVRYGSEQLLDIAEAVLAACGEEALARDSSYCRGLCGDDVLCCFFDEDSGELVNCDGDGMRDVCAAHAGCAVLLTHPPEGGSGGGSSGSGGSVGKKTKWG